LEDAAEGIDAFLQKRPSQLAREMT